MNHSQETSNLQLRSSHLNSTHLLQALRITSIIFFLKKIRQSENKWKIKWEGIFWSYILPFSFHALTATTVLRNQWTFILFAWCIWDLNTPPPNSSTLNRKKEKYPFFHHQYFQEWRYSQDAIFSLFQRSGRVKIIQMSFISTKAVWMSQGRGTTIFYRARDENKGKNLSFKSNSPNIRKCMKVGGLKLPVATRITYILLLFYWERENQCHNSWLGQ